jgi:hypothetical protein
VSGFRKPKRPLVAKIARAGRQHACTFDTLNFVRTLRLSISINRVRDTDIQGLERAFLQ